VNDARERALRAAFEAHAKDVTRLAHRLLRDPEEARDICQETFVRFHDSLDEIRGEPGPWLRAVAWRLALDALRRRRRLARGLTVRARESVATEAPDAAEVRERRDAVERALEDLSERQREVVALRVLGEEPFPEIARALGVSEGSAKVHLRRALERLRSALAPFVTSRERKP
jgi:RNA polymerase sigma-70 factor (ECF subfamily)